MSDFSLRDPEVWGAIAAVGLCIGGVVTYMARRKRPTDEELELLRRQELVQSGRDPLTEPLSTFPISTLMRAADRTACS